MSELADLLPAVQKRLDDMLSWYTDVQDCLYSGGMGSGELGRGWLETPDVWRLSGFPILESLLKAMRLGAVEPDVTLLYGPLNVFYFRCRRVRRPLMRSHKGRLQQAVLNGVPQFQVVVERDGDRQRVKAGLDWLAGAWPKVARYQPEMVEEIVKRLEKRKVAA